MELIAYIDGGARGNPGPAAIGVVINDSEGHLLFEEGVFIGHGTNNEAEYRALIYLLEKCGSEPVILKSGAKKLRVHCDSSLVVHQVSGDWKIKEPRLRELYDTVQSVKKQAPFELRIKHIPREENKRADKLVNQALDSAQSNKVLS